MVGASKCFINIAKNGAGGMGITKNSARHFETNKMTNVFVKEARQLSEIREIQLIFQMMFAPFSSHLL